MKGILNNFLLISLLPTLAMAADICPSNETSDGCWSYDGCYFLATDTTCNRCSPGKYNNDSLNSPNECKPCTNEIPGGAEQTDFTQENCPWELTCLAGTYYDKTAKKCTQCPDNQYASGDSPISFDGTEIQGRTACTQCPDNSHPNDAHTSCDCDKDYIQSSNGCIRDCNKGQYRDGDQCIDCPTGSTTSGNNATAITDCYMTQGETQFCDGSGVCIDFNTVFGSGQINYDKNN